MAKRWCVYPCFVILFIDRVHAEIFRGNDDLKKWLDTEIPTASIFHCDVATMAHYGSIMQWGNNHRQYSYNAKMDFSEFDNADPFVVASATTHAATVVSQEISAPASVKILNYLMFVAILVCLI